MVFIFLRFCHIFFWQEASLKYEDCIDEKASHYLNREDVQKALHARRVGVEEWKPCSK